MINYASGLVKLQIAVLSQLRTFSLGFLYSLFSNLTSSTSHIVLARTSLYELDAEQGLPVKQALKNKPILATLGGIFLAQFIMFSSVYVPPIYTLWVRPYFWLFLSWPYIFSYYLRAALSNVPFRNTQYKYLHKHVNRNLFLESFVGQLINPIVWPSPIFSRLMTTMFFRYSHSSVFILGTLLGFVGSHFLLIGLSCSFIYIIFKFIPKLTPKPLQAVNRFVYEYFQFVVLIVTFTYACSGFTVAADYDLPFVQIDVSKKRDSWPNFFVPTAQRFRPFWVPVSQNAYVIKSTLNPLVSSSKEQPVEESENKEEQPVEANENKEEQPVEANENKEEQPVEANENKEEQPVEESENKEVQQVEENSKITLLYDKDFSTDLSSLFYNSAEFGQYFFSEIFVAGKRRLCHNYPESLAFSHNVFQKILNLPSLSEYDESILYANWLKSLVRRRNRYNRVINKAQRRYNKHKIYLSTIPEHKINSLIISPPQQRRNFFVKRLQNKDPLNYSLDPQTNPDLLGNSLLNQKVNLSDITNKFSLDENSFELLNDLLSRDETLYLKNWVLNQSEQLNKKLLLPWKVLSEYERQAIPDVLDNLDTAKSMQFVEDPFLSWNSFIDVYEKPLDPLLLIRAKQLKSQFQLRTKSHKHEEPEPNSLLVFLDVGRDLSSIISNWVQNRFKLKQDLSKETKQILDLVNLQKPFPFYNMTTALGFRQMMNMQLPFEEPKNNEAEDKVIEDELLQQSDDLAQPFDRQQKYTPYIELNLGLGSVGDEFVSNMSTVYSLTRRLKGLIRNKFSEIYSYGVPFFDCWDQKALIEESKEPISSLTRYPSVQLMAPLQIETPVNYKRPNEVHIPDEIFHYFRGPLLLLVALFRKFQIIALIFLKTFVRFILFQPFELQNDLDHFFKEEYRLCYFDGRDGSDPTVSVPVSRLSRYKQKRRKPTVAQTTSKKSPSTTPSSKKSSFFKASKKQSNLESYDKIKALKTIQTSSLKSSYKDVSEDSSSGIEEDWELEEYTFEWFVEKFNVILNKIKEYIDVFFEKVVFLAKTILNFLNSLVKVFRILIDPWLEPLMEPIIKPYIIEPIIKPYIEPLVKSITKPIENLISQTGPILLVVRNSFGKFIKTLTIEEWPFGWLEMGIQVKIIHPFRLHPWYPTIDEKTKDVITSLKLLGYELSSKDKQIITHKLEELRLLKDLYPEYTFFTFMGEVKDLGDTLGVPGIPVYEPILASVYRNITVRIRSLLKLVRHFSNPIIRTFTHIAEKKIQSEPDFRQKSSRLMKKQSRKSSTAKKKRKNVDQYRLPVENRYRRLIRPQSLKSFSFNPRHGIQEKTFYSEKPDLVTLEMFLYDKKVFNDANLLLKVPLLNPLPDWFIKKLAPQSNPFWFTIRYKCLQLKFLFIQIKKYAIYQTLALKRFIRIEIPFWIKLQRKTLFIQLNLLWFNLIQFSNNLYERILELVFYYEELVCLKYLQWKYADLIKPNQLLIANGKLLTLSDIFHQLWKSTFASNFSVKYILANWSPTTKVHRSVKTRINQKLKVFNVLLSSKHKKDLLAKKRRKNTFKNLRDLSSSASLFKNLWLSDIPHIAPTKPIWLSLQILRKDNVKPIIERLKKKSESLAESKVNRRKTKLERLKKKSESLAESKVNRRKAKLERLRQEYESLESNVNIRKPVIERLKKKSESLAESKVNRRKAKFLKNYGLARYSKFSYNNQHKLQLSDDYNEFIRSAIKWSKRHKWYRLLNCYLNPQKFDFTKSSYEKLFNLSKPYTKSYIRDLRKLSPLTHVQEQWIEKNEITDKYFLFDPSIDLFNHKMESQSSLLNFIYIPWNDKLRFSDPLLDEAVCQNWSEEAGLSKTPSDTSNIWSAFNINRGKDLTLLSNSNIDEWNNLRTKISYFLFEKDAQELLNMVDMKQTTLRNYMISNCKKFEWIPLSWRTRLLNESLFIYNFMAPLFEYVTDQPYKAGQKQKTTIQRVLKGSNQFTVKQLLPENILLLDSLREYRVLQLLNVEKDLGKNQTERSKEVEIRPNGRIHSSKGVVNKKSVSSFDQFLWPRFRFEDMICINRFWLGVSTQSKNSLLRILMYPLVKP